MNFSSLLEKGQTVITENSTAILTAAGVAGTVATAVLTGRASFKAAEIIETTYELDENGKRIFQTRSDKVKLVWPQFIPPVAMGATTIASIIFANRISTKRAAALAAAYGISDKAFQEYKEKVVQYIGEKKETTMRDEIAQDKVNSNPPDTRSIIIAGTGDVLFYDGPTGRYFTSNMETIKQAENKVNHELVHHMYASLSLFYDAIGLPPTSYSDDVGWNNENLLEMEYSTTISEDNRPCIVIDFKVAPVTGYAKLY